MKTENMMDRLKDIDKYGKQSKGRKELTAHFEGERLTLRQMIHAKCYDCMGYYVDGRVDCNIPHCPLYPMMPHRKGEKYRVITLSKDQKAALKERGRSSQRKTPAFALEDQPLEAGEKNSPGGISTPTPGKKKISTTDRRDSQSKLSGKPDPDPSLEKKPRQRGRDKANGAQISLFSLGEIPNPYPGRKRQISSQKHT